MSTPNDIIPTPQIPLELLKQYNASSTQLLVGLCNMMTDEMLWKIAEADYGYQKEECFKMLKQIVTTQQTPKAVEFILGECLELIRWIEPKTDEEHKMRAFCAGLLLILEANSDFENLDENANLATLIESLTALDLCCKVAEEMIVWRLLHDYEMEVESYLEDDDGALYIHEIGSDEFFIYALLLLMVHNRAEGKQVVIVLNWFIDMEKERQNIAPFYNPNRDETYVLENRTNTLLLGATYHNLRHDVWKRLSQNMLAWKTYLKNEEIVAPIEKIVACITNELPLKF